MKLLNYLKECLEEKPVNRRMYEWSKQLKDYSSEINYLGKAIVRTRIKMDKLEAPFSFPENCCPSCACGYEWVKLSEKYTRQVKWLIILLKRKGYKEDARFWSTEV